MTTAYVVTCERCGHVLGHTATAESAAYLADSEGCCGATTVTALDYRLDPPDGPRWVAEYPEGCDALYAAVDAAGDPVGWWAASAPSVDHDPHGATYVVVTGDDWHDPLYMGTDWHSAALAAATLAR